MRKIRIITCLVILLTLFISIGCSSEAKKESSTQGNPVLAQAKDMQKHGLLEKAEEKYLDLLYNPSTSKEDKSEALYWLGQAAFESGKFTVAIEDWEKLIADYPDSEKAKDISSKIKDLKEITTTVLASDVDSPIANMYLSYGDFWNGSDKKVMIDSSWFPQADMAIEWYDKVIMEFKGKPAAKLAYEKKIFALLGWDKSSYYSNERYGAKADLKKYMPLIIETFDAYSKEYPDSQYIQGFRYAIAQTYWNKKDWVNTRAWLQKIIDAGKEKEDFYTQAARFRLQKIEY